MLHILTDANYPTRQTYPRVWIGYEFVCQIIFWVQFGDDFCTPKPYSGMYIAEVRVWLVRCEWNKITVYILLQEEFLGILMFMLLPMLQSGAMRSWSRHQKCKRSSSISLCLFSSLLLNWPMLEIYNVLCTSHCVIFIMFLLSWDRSLGRCF